MACGVKIKYERDPDDIFDKSDDGNRSNIVDCKNSDNNLINLHIVKQEVVDSETDYDCYDYESDSRGNCNIKSEDIPNNTLYEVKEENFETNFVEIKVENLDESEDPKSNYIIPVTDCNSLKNTYKVKQKTNDSETQLEIKTEVSTTQTLCEIKEECTDLGVDYISVNENSKFEFKNIEAFYDYSLQVGKQQHNIIRTYQNRKKTKNVANQQRNIAQTQHCNQAQNVADQQDNETLKNSNNVAYAKDSTKYQCDECNKEFKCKSTLKAHMKVHTGEKPFKCPICDIGFLRRSDLNLHLKRHEGFEQFHCNSCDSAFVTIGELEEHFNSKHSEIKAFIPVKCSKCSATNKPLARHTNIHSDNKSFVCEVCCSLREYKIKLNHQRYREKNREKLRQREVERRRRKKNMSKASNINRTDVTNEEISDSRSSCASEETKHSIQENSNAEESTVMKRKRSLQRYREKNREKLKQREAQRRLMAPRNFPCEHCGKVCATKSSLLKHTNLHTDEDHFECDICFWRYSDAYALKRHMTVHTKKEVTPCVNCGRVCANNGAQIRHVRVCARYCVNSN